MALKATIDILEKASKALNIPLMFTGIAAFFGYNLDIRAARVLLQWLLPDHINAVFASFGTIHAITILLYAIAVAGWFAKLPGVTAPELPKGSGTPFQRWAPRIFLVASLAAMVLMPLILGPVFAAIFFFPQCAGPELAACVQLREREPGGGNFLVFLSMIFAMALVMAPLALTLLRRPRQGEAGAETS